MLVGVMAACSSIYVEKADTVDDEAGSRANYFAEISRAGSAAACDGRDHIRSVETKGL